MKHFEVRATGMDGQELYRTVACETSEAVHTFFQELCFRDIYVQEVPMTECTCLRIGY